MNRATLLLLLLLLAIAVPGCASGKASPCGPGISAGVSLPALPPLSELFTGPPKPVCIPKDGCVAVYGDEWKALGPCGQSAPKADPMVLVPMKESTLSRIVGSKQTCAAEAPDAPEPAAVRGEYPMLIKRTVTRYEEGVPRETTVETPAPAGTSGG